MKAIESRFFTVTCSRCDEDVIEDTERAAIKLAIIEGFRDVNGKTYCKDCAKEHDDF